MNKAAAQFTFTIIMFLFFIYTLIEAASFKKLAKYFPFYISIIALVMLAIEIIRQIINFKKSSESGEVMHPNIKGVIKYTFYLIIYVGLVYLIGIVLASLIYVFVFLYFIAQMKWWQASLTVVILLVFIVQLGKFMNLHWPKSLFSLL